MKIAKLGLVILMNTISLFNYAQETNKNSETRKFIDNAEFTQVNRNWNTKAEFRSGLGEIVSFFPVEAIDLKSNSKINSLQMDMTVTDGNRNYFKSSWIDLVEVNKFTNFIELYVVPNLNDKTEKNQSTTYVYNSKEIQFSFYIGQNFRRISIYLKDLGVTDYHHYFWTETQINKISALLNTLKQIK